MNICMFVSTDMSHDARVWKEATTLAKDGHDITVLAAFNPDLPEQEQSGKVRVIRVHPHSTLAQLSAPIGTDNGVVTASTRQQSRQPRLSWIRGWLWLFRSYFRAWQLAVQLKPDVIHIHDADRLLLGRLASLTRGCPFVYDSHEFFAGLLIENDLAWRVMRRWLVFLERLFVRNARCVITVSAPIAAELKKRYLIREQVLIHNYPNLHSITASPKASVRSHFAAKYQHLPLLLYQGRLVPHRGVETFIETVASIELTIAIIVGGGPSRDYLQQYARDRGVADRIVFIPQVPWNELANYTAQADLAFYLQPATCSSYYLTLPNKLFEYMMSGIPVVACDYPAIRAIVNLENVGVTVPPTDIPTIVATVRQLLDDPQRLALMRSNALTVSRLTYNWESQEEVLVGVYRRLKEIVKKD